MPPWLNIFLTHEELPGGTAMHSITIPMPPAPRPPQPGPFGPPPRIPIPPGGGT